MPHQTLDRMTLPEQATILAPSLTDIERKAQDIVADGKDGMHIGGVPNPAATPTALVTVVAFAVLVATPTLTAAGGRPRPRSELRDGEETVAPEMSERLATAVSVRELLDLRRRLIADGAIR